MKVKITGHTPIEGINWWYKKQIGRVLEVAPISPLAYKSYERYIVTKGIYTGRTILKQDCEIINE